MWFCNFSETEIKQGSCTISVWCGNKLSLARPSLVRYCWALSTVHWLPNLSHQNFHKLSAKKVSTSLIYYGWVVGLLPAEAMRIMVVMVRGWWWSMVRGSSSCPSQGVSAQIRLETAWHCLASAPAFVVTRNNQTDLYYGQCLMTRNRKNWSSANWQLLIGIQWTGHFICFLT